MRRLGYLAAIAALAVAGLIAARRPAVSPVARSVTVSGELYNAVMDTRTHRAFALGGVSGPASPSGQTITIYTYSAAYTGTLSTFDTASGALLRTVTLGPNPVDLALDQRSGRVFVTDIVDGTVRVLDARSGALLRMVNVGAMQPHDLHRIAVDERTGRVFVSAADVQMLDARSGAMLDSIVAGDETSLAVDEATGRVFVTSYAVSRVTLLDAASGAIIRSVAVGSSPLHLLVAARAGRVFAQGDRGLTMLDARTGRVLRAIPVGAGRFDEMSSDDATGRLFVVASGACPQGAGSVTVLDARSGALIRTLSMLCPGSPLMDAASGHVFIASSNAVAMLDARSGALLHTVAVTRPGNMIVDERRGRVYVVNDSPWSVDGPPTAPGGLTVLDARTGAVRSTLSLGLGPITPVLDEATGRLLITMQGGLVPTPGAWEWLPSWLRHIMPFVPRQAPGMRRVPGGMVTLDTSRL